MRNRMKRVPTAVFGLVMLGVVPGVSLGADAAAGQVKFATCAACHGAQGGGTPISPVPLAGRANEEISALLNRYRAGETVGAQSPLMFPHASALSDGDIANLAAYINSL